MNAVKLSFHGALDNSVNNCVKFFLFVALLAVSGCAIIPEDPLKNYEYSIFEGSQKMWDVKDRNFAPTELYGIEYYGDDQKPNRLYIVVARLKGVQATTLNESRDRVARYTAKVGGDAFIEEGGVQEAFPYSGGGMGVVSGVGGFIVKYIPINYIKDSGLHDVLSAWVWCGDNEDGAVYDGKTVTASEIKIIKGKAFEDANKLINDYWISIRDSFPRENLTEL